MELHLQEVLEFQVQEDQEEQVLQIVFQVVPLVMQEEVAEE